MDSINAAASHAEYAQVNGRSIPVIRRKIEKYEGPLTVDDLKPSTRTEADIIASWRSSLSLNAMTTGKISDAAQNARSEMDGAIVQFLDGRLSTGELSEKFQSVLSELSEACNERGYPTLLGLDKYGQQALADGLHNEYRKKLLDAAVTRNNQEGAQYAANSKNGNWQYYNANWYDKSMEGVEALADGAMQFCHDRGYDNFQLSDGKQPWKLEVVWPKPYDDFNGAWMARNGSTQTFLDPDMVPPEGFQWFCESGGTRTASSDGMIIGITGSVREADQEDYSVFHPDDLRSMRMWASFQDEDGTMQRVEKIFGFARGENSPQNVAALMAFAGKDSVKASAVNAFLKNMQVYLTSYRSSAKAMDLRV